MLLDRANGVEIGDETESFHSQIVTILDHYLTINASNSFLDVSIFCFFNSILWT